MENNWKKELEQLEKINEAAVENAKNKLEDAVRDGDKNGILYYEGELNAFEWMLNNIREILGRG